jgi:hypothetical protein
VIEALRVDYSPRMFGPRSNMLGMVVVLAGAITYLAVSRRRHRRRLMVQPASRQRMLRPRSSRATSGSIGLTGSAEALGPDETNPPGAVSGPHLQH